MKGNTAGEATGSENTPPHTTQILFLVQLIIVGSVETNTKHSKLNIYICNVVTIHHTLPPLSGIFWWTVLWYSFESWPLPPSIGATGTPRVAPLRGHR